jgi:SsrA-binding protein
VAKKDQDGRKVIASNRRARHDYQISDTFEAGLVLVGTEVKSLRDGHASLKEAFVGIENGEAWLMGSHIREYSHGNINNHAPLRKRKLLLHAHEIEKIEQRVNQKGFSAIPMVLYFRKGKAKLEFGLGKGKKLHDKRQAERAKNAKRDLRDLRDAV